MRRAAAIALALGLAVALTLGLWPLVPRHHGGTAPAPMAEAPLDPALADRLTGFLETEAQGIDGLVVHRDGALAYRWGDAQTLSNLASVRKSVMSLLYGAAIDRGLIDLDTTLADLGIDESATPLTEVEKSATLRDLIRGRSGIYLLAGGETPLVEATRPQRGSAVPGAQFFYNNWDFNVLGVVFEEETGLEIGAALEQWIAQPLGMEDFHPSHAYVDRATTGSDYPAYRLHMSARDLARLGTLVVQRGVWEGERVVSAGWAREMITPHSEVGPPWSEPPISGYGYMWWINPETGDAIAAGWGGQYLLADSANGLSIAVLNDTGASRLGHLWFRWFGTAGRAQDLLTIHGLLTAP